MGKINWFNKIITLGHPYKMSLQSYVYEEVAEVCGTTPDRVYQIAHGAKLKTFDDTAIFSELKRRGVIQRK